MLSHSSRTLTFRPIADYYCWPHIVKVDRLLVKWTKRAEKAALRDPMGKLAGKWMFPKDPRDHLRFLMERMQRNVARARKVSSRGRGIVLTGKLILTVRQDAKALRK